MVKSKRTMLAVNDWTYRGAPVGVEIHFKERAGRMEVREVTVRADDSGDSWAPITAQMLRKLPLGGFIAKWRRDLRKTLAVHDEGSMRDLAPLFGARRGVAFTPDELAEIAAVYREATRFGASPRQAIRVRFGIPESTAAKRIRAARDAGLLGAAIPGKAGEA